MKKYINRQGLEVNADISELIECDTDSFVEEMYVVTVVEKGLDGGLLGEEFFSNKPSETQIQYCLIKHKPINPEQDFYATVEKCYQVGY